MDARDSVGDARAMARFSERELVRLYDDEFEKDGKPETLFRLALAQAQAGEVQLGIHNLKRVAAMARTSRRFGPRLARC